MNAIYVATPPDTHAFYTIKSLNAGKPVYVEKPMALNYAQCLAMIETAKVNHLPLFVAYYRRRLLNFLKVKELIDQGIIGKVHSVSLRLKSAPKPGDTTKDNLPWRVKPEISGGGHFVDLGAHQFDILDYILGPIKKAVGIASNLAGLYPAEDTVGASFEFENLLLIPKRHIYCPFEL